MLIIGSDTISFSNGVAVGASSMNVYTPAVSSDDADLILLESDDSVLLESGYKVVKEEGISVTYYGNENTSGTVPDSQNYTVGDTATVSDNTGTLARDGYTFSGWNTAANGSGTDYAAAATFEISADVTLYAKWVASDPVIELTVPALPTITSTTGVISEDPISADALELTAPAVPTISVSTEVDETP